MGKIALELVRNQDGHIVGIGSFNPYSLKECTSEPDKYVQLYNGKPVQTLNKKDIVIAEVFYE